MARREIDQRRSREGRGRRRRGRNSPTRQPAHKTWSLALPYFTQTAGSRHLQVKEGVYSNSSCQKRNESDNIRSDGQRSFVRSFATAWGRRVARAILGSRMWTHMTQSQTTRTTHGRDCSLARAHHNSRFDLSRRLGRPCSVLDRAGCREDPAQTSSEPRHARCALDTARPRVAAQPARQRAPAARACKPSHADTDGVHNVSHTMSHALLCSKPMPRSTFTLVALQARDRTHSTHHSLERVVPQRLALVCLLQPAVA